MWEAFEYFAFWWLPHFPFVGEERVINKFIGDPIADGIGILMAWLIIRRIK